MLTLTDQGGCGLSHRTAFAVTSSDPIASREGLCCPICGFAQNQPMETRYSLSFWAITLWPPVVG